MIRIICIFFPLIASFMMISAADQIDAIRTAVRSDYLSSSPCSDVLTMMQSLDDHGRWKDIDYSDRSRSLWQLEKHLDRLVDMALAYEQCNKSDSILYGAIIRGLDQWFDGHYKNDNWWYTKIGMPRRLLALAYILDDDLTMRHRAAIDEALDAIDSDDFPARPGGDRIQVLSNHAKVLLWRKDLNGLENIFHKIEAEARIAPYEETMYDAGGSLAVRIDMRPAGRGVQSDMSFHHRGDRVDSTLTYGLELPLYFSYWALLLKDTNLAFSQASIHFVIDYYLDGVSRHLVAGRYAEPTILNRELSRPGAGVMKSDIANKLLSISDGFRSSELISAISAIDSGNVANDVYAVDFRQSAYFAFSRPRFQSAVRYYSERNANQEAPHNSEGIRNHFRGDGACMLSISGREYADIAPIFDFRLIPGATTPLIPYDPLSDWGDLVIFNSPISFAGAVNDSVYGAVAFDFSSSRSRLKARKGYFFFDRGYVCLGSGISADSPYQICTTVEQCLSPTHVVTRNKNHFFHNGNIYRILQGKASGSVSHKKGTWRNCVENVEYADSVAEADIFTLTIDHGKNPHNAKYAYAVYPGISDLSTLDDFKVLANDHARQCVASADGKIVYVIFYEPGRIKTPHGYVSADAPCMILIRNGNKLSVADPTGKLESVNIKTPSGLKCVKLPSGELSGSSITINFLN